MDGENPIGGLPHRGLDSGKNPLVLGHHLILTGYGHWIANDPRGSGSTELRQEKFGDLGSVHFGRKRIQPSREAVKSFYRAANPRLDFKPMWFDGGRKDIGKAFSRVPLPAVDSRRGKLKKREVIYG
jgi:hypothetical protein